MDKHMTKTITINLNIFEVLYNISLLTQCFQEASLPLLGFTSTRSYYFMQF